MGTSYLAALRGVSGKPSAYAMAVAIAWFRHDAGGKAD